MRLQAGIMHSRDLRMPLEEPGNGEGVLALTLDSNAERFDAANQEIRRARVHTAAEIDNHLADAVHPIRIANGDAGDDIGVAGKSFCGTVNDHVVAECDGTLQDRRGESVVDDGTERVFLRQGHGFVNTDETKRWV